jgi:molybdate/tungstate transport system permease protein
VARGAAGGRRHVDRSGVPLVVLGGLVFLFLALPVLGLAFNLSGSDLLATYRDPQTQDAVRVSFATATASTLIVGALGIPLAYLLARFRFPGKTVVSLLVFLPLVLPPVSAGILLLLLYGPYGMVGSLFSPHGFEFVDTSSGIMLAQIFVSAPYVIVAARSSFERIEPEYEEAAAAMGAGIAQTFWHVALPMSRGGILAGLLLGWLRSLGEFGATVILAYHPYSLPVLNYVYLNSTGLAQALPVALLALVAAGTVLICVFFFERVDWAAGLGRP